MTVTFGASVGSGSARCSTPVTVSAGTAVTPGGSPGDNQPPVITFKTTPDAVGDGIKGAAPLMVRFNVCLTADPEGDTLHFTMDLDGDGKLDKRGSTGASCRGDWTYAAGTWFAEVCVTDLALDGSRIHEYQCRVYTVAAS